MLIYSLYHITETKIYTISLSLSLSLSKKSSSFSKAPMFEQFSACLLSVSIDSTHQHSREMRDDCMYTAHTHRGSSSIAGDILITISSCIIQTSVSFVSQTLSFGFFFCQFSLHHSVLLLHGAIHHQPGILSMVFTFSHTTMHNLSYLPRWSCTVEHKLCSHPEGHGVTDPADIKDLMQTIKHILPWHSCLFNWTPPHQHLRANLLFIDAISVTLNKL